MQSITLPHTHPSSTALCFPLLLRAVKQKHVRSNGERRDDVESGEKKGMRALYMKINLTGSFSDVHICREANFHLLAEQIGKKKCE